MRRAEARTRNVYSKNGLRKNWPYRDQVPYERIIGAIAGNTADIAYIVRHFGGYMMSILMDEKTKANEPFRFMRGKVILEPDDEDCIEAAKVALIQSLSAFSNKY